MEKELFAAEIVNTHGIRGEVKAICHTDSAEFFNNIKNIRLEPSNASFVLTASRPHKGAVLLKLKGVDTIEDAEKLVGQKIYVQRSEARLPEGRYYITDIIGLKVISEEGEEIGTVIDVFRTGSNDVFEVKRKGLKNAYIPHIDDIVKEIDLEKGITIHVMEGLLDED